jgi:hypothetical protein
VARFGIRRSLRCQHDRPTGQWFSAAPVGIMPSDLKRPTLTFPTNLSIEVLSDPVSGVESSIQSAVSSSRTFKTESLPALVSCWPSLVAQARQSLPLIWDGMVCSCSRILFLGLARQIECIFACFGVNVP